MKKIKDIAIDDLIRLKDGRTGTVVGLYEDGEHLEFKGRKGVSTIPTNAVDCVLWRGTVCGRCGKDMKPAIDILGDAREVYHMHNRAHEDALITVDIEKLAARMIQNGFTKERLNMEDFDGWTNALVDALEEFHNFETVLIEYIKHKD